MSAAAPSTALATIQPAFNDAERLALAGFLAGYRGLTITRKGGKVVTIPLAPRTARAIDLAIGERTGGPVFLAADGRAAGPARRRADRPQGRAPLRHRQGRHASYAQTRVHSLDRHATYIVAAYIAGAAR